VTDKRGTIVGDVVDLIGTPQPALGKIYLMYDNVGLMQHTTTGGFWDSGAMNKTDAYIWVPDRTGVLPYTCNFHKTQMIASLRIIA
jgi:hypothetical protein